MYSKVRVWHTLEYVLPGHCVYSRARPTRVGRTLEYVVTAVAMDYRFQKLPRVRGDSYTGFKFSCHSSLFPSLSNDHPWHLRTPALGPVHAYILTYLEGR